MVVFVCTWGLSQRDADPCSKESSLQPYKGLFNIRTYIHAYMHAYIHTYAHT